MIKKTKIIVPFIVILSAMLLGVFKSTPLVKFTTYSFLIISIFGHITIFRHYKYYPIQIRFWYKVGLLLMFVSIILQYSINRQSLISGFVANFRFFNIGVVVYIYYLVIKYKISLKRFFYGLIIAGWVNLIIIGIFALTGFSLVITSEITGVMTDLHTGKLGKLLVNLVAIIYLIQYSNKGNYKQLIFSILFFSSHHWHDVQRFAFLIQILTIIFAIKKSINLRIRIKTLLPVLFFGSFVILGLFNSKYGQSVFNKFSQAFLVLQDDNQNKITDMSTAARLREADIALEYFYKSPVFGNGLFRSSEKMNIFGNTHFYLSDVGVFGVLYSFGVLGILVLLFQYKYLFENRNMGHISPWLKISIFFLLFIQLESIITGKSILMFSVFMFCVLMLELSKTQSKLILK